MALGKGSISEVIFKCNNFIHFTNFTHEMNVLLTYCYLQEARNYAYWSYAVLLIFLFVMVMDVHFITCTLGLVMYSCYFVL